MVMRSRSFCLFVWLKQKLPDKSCFGSLHGSGFSFKEVRVKKKKKNENLNLSSDVNGHYKDPPPLSANSLCFLPPFI